MIPLTHDVAARNLRTLAIDSGFVEDTQSLDFILDELRESRIRNARLILERDEMKQQRNELLSTLRTVPQFKRVAEEMVKR